MSVKCQHRLSNKVQLLTPDTCYIFALLTVQPSILAPRLFTTPTNHS